MTSTAEWTVLEKLLLAQAVYKFGEDNWFQIARNLRQHSMLNRQPDFFNQKNCSLQYYLLIEDLETEKRQTKAVTTAQDMPPVVKLARQLYMQRMDELKQAIKEDDDKFMQLVGEIEEIRSGKWDAKLATQVPTPQLPQQQPSTPEQPPPELDQKQPIHTEKEADTQNDQEHTESAVIPPAEVVPTEEKNLTPVLLENEPISIEAREPEISLVASAPEEATPEQALQVEPHVTTLPVVSESTIEQRPETPAMSTSPQSNTSYQSALEATISSVYPPEVPIEQPQEAIEEPEASSHGEGEKRKVEEDFEMVNEPASKRQRVEEPTNETKYQSKSQEQFDEAQREQASEPKSPEAISTKSPEAPLSVSADAEGNESVTGSESNAPTPTSSSDKRRNKDEQRQQKSWQKNINLLWREIANHKNGAMFMNPIKEATAPLYYDVVRHPMDLKTIKNRIRDGVIKTTIEFERDIVLMLTNSLMYNKEGTEIYQMALEMLEDVNEQMKLFKTADSNSSSTSTHTRKASTVAKDRRRSVAE